MKKHYAIILLACFVALISSMPQYTATKSVPNFQGIYSSPANDGLYYEARVRDVIDGHPFLSNPFIAEYKNGFPLQVWLPDYIMAKGIQLFHVSVPAGFIVWTALLSFIIVLLAYAICFSLTDSRKWSFLGTLFILLGLFSGSFLRLPSPGFNFVFWLSTLLCLILFIKTEKNKYAVLAALLFGLLFNFYPYFWTFYVVVFGVFLVLMLLLRGLNFPYRKWLLILIGAMIIGIPYFISTWQSSRMPTYTETLQRISMIATHFPSGLDSVMYAFVFAVLFLIFYFRKYIKKDTLTVFLFSGVLSAAIVVNQHVITGKNLEFSSHYILGNGFWFFFSGLFLLCVFLENRPKKIQDMIFGICVLAVCVYIPIKTYALARIETTYTPEEIYAQNYTPIFNWLDQNAKKDDVVYADDAISGYIPIYTSQNIYFNGASILFFMSNQEAENRFIINHYFDTFTPDFVVAHSKQVYGAFYIDQYNHNLSKNELRKVFGLRPVSYTYIPDSVIQKTIADAQVIQKENFDTALHTYRVDYIVWDKSKDPNWRIPFKLLFEANNIAIYAAK